MAAKTTVKVATLTGAAKDDFLVSGSTGLTEENLSAKLDVLSNDPGSAKVYSLLQNGATTLASITQFPVITSAKLASGATVSINADGTIGYNASTVTTNLQAYGAGEVFTDTFEYTIRMANGALSTAKATVEIAGVNDVPTLASIAPVSILDTAEADAAGIVEGKLAGTDADRTAVLRYSFLDGSQESTDPYGTLTLDAVTGIYRFVANASKVDALNAGATAKASFEVKVQDEHGAASAPATLQFDLIGVNDIASISGTVNGGVTEDGMLAATGKLIVIDRDTGESIFQMPTSLSGAYGDFTFDVATGEWAYSLRNGDANVQALKGGALVSDTLVITSFDGTASETISVDVAGTNDAAKIEGDITGSVSEDGDATASGVLTVQDIDTGEAGFRTPESLAGQYGTFSIDVTTGEWTYSLANDSEQVQALAGNQKVIDKLVLTSIDGSTSETIQVSVTGLDETPAQGGGTDSAPVNKVERYLVNHGRNDNNGDRYNSIENFDSNDFLAYTPNYKFKNLIVTDIGNDGIFDSVATFEFKTGGVASEVEIVLIGYAGLTASQIVVVS
ncbi:VCBS domain-containing protein [Herbaspirillum sp. GCM10030257]|uniref:VCBS domain-containing protein n=1 Tax=Herbaspirillum sp. GCM10030257 TaxID=3273393 RepID=UPI00361C4109